MPITINGSGTVTGITAGGLPDGSITPADIAATGTPSSTTYLRGDGVWSTVSGGVTSATAGNGIAVSASTGAVTFSAAAPSFNTVGSYALVKMNQGSYPYSNMSWTSGSDYAAGNGKNQLNSGSLFPVGQYTSQSASNNLSGTWRWLGNSATLGNVGCCQYWTPFAIAVRVA
jgi:hypothetical protein